jgi:hypothetical protein
MVALGRQSTEKRSIRSAAQSQKRSHHCQKILGTSLLRPVGLIPFVTSHHIEPINGTFLGNEVSIDEVLSQLCLDDDIFPAKMMITSAVRDALTNVQCVSSRLSDAETCMGAPPSGCGR